MIAGEYILHVGNMYPYKNLARVIEALPLIHQEHPELKLVLAGQGDAYQAELEKQAKELGVEKHVVFPGRVDDAQLVNLYQHAKLLVFPSLSEGFGLSALEAMAYGVPVAAARASCLPEVCGDAAVYFDPNNTQDVAKTLSSLLSDKPKLVAMKAAGIKHVKQYSWRKMAEQTLAVYKQALNQK